MIVGIGTDLVDIDRISRIMDQYPQRFRHRLFTVHEQAYCQASSYPAASFAKRFAAKEAFVKALGTGFRNGISWQDIEVINSDAGQPNLNIKGYTLEYIYQKFGSAVYHYDLSLTDTATLAQAFVIISRQA